jgi:hypothetical protein
LKKTLHIVVAGGTLLTAIGTLWHASVMVITINILSLILLFGVVNNGQVKLLANTVFAAIAQFFSGFFCFFRKEKQEESFEKKNKKTSSIWQWIKLGIIPLFVLVVFYLLYSAASSKFSNIFGFIGKWISEAFNHLFDYFNPVAFFLFCFGFIISCAYFVKTKMVQIFEEPQDDMLVRKKTHFMLKPLSKVLQTEFRIGVIMFIMLNALLLLFNITDIWYVWFNFEWDGQVLKEFVHEGTYTLIFSLLISMGIVLYFFRGNLNFFSQNKLIKILANIWLAQNMIMTISVLIRNLRYIEYYNLAYLRIGVLLFVILTMFAIITVFIKVNTPKNTFYLLRVNMLAIYVGLALFSLADWDVIIAKTNLNRSQEAFVHLNFLANLSNKALPYLDKPEWELKKAENNEAYRQEYVRYMTAEEYVNVIEERSTEFLQKYPSRTWLEWNYADHKAYHMLLEKD